MKFHKASFQAFLTSCFFFLFINSFAQLPTIIEVSGDIAENTEWSDDTVKVTGDITVLDDVILTIDPGTYVEFQGHYSLIIKGTLLAVGTESDTIKFTIRDTTGFHLLDSPEGGWNRIIFNNTPYLGGANYAMNDNDTSVIDHCLLEYSKFVDYDLGLIDGGAINVNEFSSLKIINSTLRHNSSIMWGGAISLVRDADILIQHNTIVHNVGMQGGGIGFGISNPMILDNYIAYNKTFPNDFEGGGGIYSMTNRPVIRGNTVVYNSSLTGAGVMCNNSDAFLADNTIAYNTGTGDDSKGGGIFLVNESKPFFVNNLVANNSANSGGGVYLDHSEPMINNNLIVNNYAETEGGGLKLHGADAEVLNNTIINNQSNESGGGIAISECSPRFINCIIWGNTATVGGQVYQIDGFSVPDFFYCNIEDGKDGFGGRDFLGIYENNISVDPGLENPTTGSGLSFDGTQADFSLNQNSLCINAGKPDMEGYWMPETDFSGGPRVNHSIIDQGAYEAYIPSIDFSDTILSDTTWIADTVYIMGDVYVLDGATLNITPGTVVKFKGHYMINVQGVILAVGTENEMIQFTVDDTTGLTDLDTTIGGWNGIMFDNGYEGADGAMWDNDTSKLVNCIIEYGKAMDASIPGHGGAIHVNLFNKLLIAHCEIHNNWAESLGGGIYCYRSSPVIKSNEITNNYANSGGGAIACEYADPLIENNLIQQNITADRGGGIYNLHSDPLIVNNILSYNSAAGVGGGICCWYSSPHIVGNYILNNVGDLGGGIGTLFQYTELINNVIANNEGRKGGAIYYYLVDEALLLNNTITNNIAYGVGGAIHMIYSNPEAYNNIIWNNEASGGMQVNIPSHLEKPVFMNNNIQGGVHEIRIGSGGEFEGEYIDNIDTLPFFIEPSEGAGISFDGLSADWNLMPVSPCINMGTTSITRLHMPAKDIAGSDRVFWDQVDMGAFENHYGKPVITLQPLNQIVCSGDTVSMHLETEEYSFIQWQKDGADITGATQNELIVDSVSAENDGNYQAVVTNAFGSVLTTPVYMIARSAPEIMTQPENTWLVEGEKNALVVEGTGTPPLHYTWFKNGVLIPGQKSQELNFTDPDATDEGEYRSEISNTCGTVRTDPVSVYLAPQICMVTVDTAEGVNKNMVIWEKNTSAPLSSYNIYRESYILGNYSLIGSVPFGDLSVFRDDDADPRTQAYWYKITAVDTADNESPLEACQPHKTIHLLVTLNPETGWIQLDWDNYIGFEYYTYNIFSRNLTQNETDFVLAYPMASSTSTRSVPIAADLIYYRVAVERPAMCYPTGNQKADSGPYSYSISNTEDNRLKTGVAGMNPERDFSIYPNPFHDKATIGISNPSGDSYMLIITDISGKVQRITNHINTSQFILEKNDLLPGIYFIELFGPEIYKGKIIIE